MFILLYCHTVQSAYFRNYLSTDISLGLDRSRLAEETRLCGFLRLWSCPSTWRCLLLFWCFIPWSTTWKVWKHEWRFGEGRNRRTFHSCMYCPKHISPHRNQLYSVISAKDTVNLLLFQKLFLSDI